MQIKKPKSSVDALFGPPAPEVEYVAPPKTDDALIEKADQAMAIRPMRRRCVGVCGCGSWEGIDPHWSKLCEPFAQEFEDPFSVTP